ncbi:hypothetical protein C8R47DRAFT_1303319 [Mycena vitilis]|nr:hypothetical protein C8R47DRAFT_1303319 [Mycena vitilis]
MDNIHAATSRGDAAMWYWVAASGSLHRDGIVYDGHYDPWIEDENDILYQSLPFDNPRETHPGYVNVSLYQRTEESFFISELPQKIRDDYNIPPHESPRINSDLGPLPLVKLSGGRTCRYEFLAASQNTKFAVAPIHTNEEYALFNSAARPGGQFGNSTGPPNFKEMAKWWSTRVNGKTTFYKLPEQLQAHHKTWSGVRDEMATMQKTAPQRQEFTDLIRTDAHTSVVLDESYSPVVRARNAASNTASVTSRYALERRAVLAKSLSAPSTSHLQTVMAAAHFHPRLWPAANQGPVLQLPTHATTGGSSGKRPRAPKKCKVCKSKGKSDFEALNCRGRGKRNLSEELESGGHNTKVLISPPHARTRPRPASPLSPALCYPLRRLLPLSLSLGGKSGKKGPSWGYIRRRKTGLGAAHLDLHLDDDDYGNVYTPALHLGRPKFARGSLFLGRTRTDPFLADAQYDRLAL